MQLDIHKYIDEFFQEGGILSKKLDQFEYREGQVGMCHNVADVLADSGILLVEAGTGIGKTMAYLIPSLLIDDRVVISTGTKTLQEQIFTKDIPFLRKTGYKNISACYMKGRNNYLCLYRFHDVSKSGLLPLGGELEYWPMIEDWATRTVSGDRSELGTMPENLILWNELSADADDCMVKKCEYYDDCYLYKMRKQAENSQLIIVNHHLFFADLYLKSISEATLIPEFNRVIFDEAHLLEDVAIDYFSMKSAGWQLPSLIKDLDRKMHKLHKEIGSRMRKMITHQAAELQKLSNHFYNSFPHDLDNRFALADKILNNEKKEDASALIAQVKEFANKLKASGAANEEWQIAVNNFTKFAQELDFIITRDNNDYVYWGEFTEKGSAVLNATPIEISAILKQHLWSSMGAAVLTSATLSSHGSFDFIKNCLGIEQCKGSIFKSPFNYKEQAMLYIPRKFPEPSHQNFVDAVADAVSKIIEISKGRAFVLFTSFQNMRRVYEKIKDVIEYPILLQGDKPKTKLIEEFKERGNAVLLATNSFWQGVDVAGEALSCVIIDKLPFSVPTDPVIEAKVERIRKQDKNPFYEYQLPEAVLSLRQGLGRLIRSKNDRGIMALLDKRVYEKEYGRYVIMSLNEMNITNDINLLKQQWD